MSDTTNAADLCAQVKTQLEGCQCIEDFVRVYDSLAFQQILARMRESLTASGGNNEVWAYDWAIRMRTTLGGPDLDLNQYRKTVLYLLYELCNAWKDAQNPSVTEESIVKIFQGHRVENMLLLALPLDRAQCLYAMKYPRATLYGMHWVSSEHFETDQSVDWRTELHDRDGRSTMNKRLVWLGNLQGLQFGSADIPRWLQPQRFDLTMQE